MKTKWRVGSHFSSCLWWFNDVSSVQVSLTGEETHVTYQKVRHIQQATADLYHPKLSECVAEAATSRRSLHHQDRLLSQTFVSLMFMFCSRCFFCWSLHLSADISSACAADLFFPFNPLQCLTWPCFTTVATQAELRILQPQRRCMCLKLCKGFILTPD